MTQGRLRMAMVLALGAMTLDPARAAAAGPATSSSAERGRHPAPSLVETSDPDRRIDINNINMWAANNGTFAFAGATSVFLAGGLIYPKGSAKNAVFGSGIWLSGKVGGEIRTAAGQYSTEYGPGPMVGTTFADPASPAHRVYKMARYAGNPSDSAHVDRSPEELTGDPVLDPVLHHSWSEYLAGAAPYGAPTRLYRLPDTSTPAPSDSVDMLGPDVSGDQMLWSVYNDADPSLHNNVFQTIPLGVEVQQTTFGFNRQGALGSTVFLKYVIINKGGNQLDTMYVSLWSDPDLGDLSDDLVGCDSTLSLGFAYNANNNDRTYGIAPAVGYDFFLGPVNKATGDTLGLASFDKYINGTDPGTAGQVYNYQRGLSRDGDPIIDPTTGLVTSFYHPGDPVQGTGWLDALPSDRRFLLSAGPFSMAPGDTQTVVGAIVVAQGNDRLSSVAGLKFFDLTGQDAFDRNFDLPSPPASPQTAVAIDHGKLRLCWDSVSRLGYTQPGYRFEGYNVYQGSSETGPWKRIATYDEINSVRVIYDQTFDLTTGQIIPSYPVAFGSDNGIRYCQVITQDAIRGGSLKDATEYYFAVTAYSYGAGQTPRVLETSQQVIRVIPQRPAAGTDPATASALPIQYTQGDPGRLPTTDQVVVEVVDPSAVTGHTYEVTFEPLSPPVFGVVGSDTATVLSSWRLNDATLGQALLTGQLNRRGDDDYQVVDGLRVKEVGSYFPLLRDAYYVENDATHAGVLWGWDGLPFYFGGAGAASDFGEVTTTLNPAADPDSFVPVEIRFSHTTTQKAYRFLRREAFDTTGVCTSGDPPPGGRGYLYGGFHDVPFTAWDTARNRQLEVAFVERSLTDCAGATLPSADQPATQNSTWGPGIAPADGSEYLLVLASAYSGAENPTVAQDGALIDNSLPLMYALVSALNPFDPDPVIDDGDAFFFDWKIPATPNDSMRFDTRAIVRGNSDLARQRLNRVRVVPNPYYNQSRYELSPTSRIVRFTNLPEVATIRIFNLAGQLARTLHKTDATSSILEWDLQTDVGLPVGSGIYVYHIDAPGVGSTFGRMAIFMESERLLNY